MIVDRYDAFLFDLDGVLYRGSEPIPSAADAVEGIRARGKRVAFMTNNSARTPDAIVAHSRRQQDLLWRLHARLMQRTGRPAEEIAEDTRNGLYLDARQALDYGLIDEITSITRQYE